MECQNRAFFLVRSYRNQILMNVPTDVLEIAISNHLF